MKHLIKKHSKTLLLVGVCLFSCEVFSASEATKRMIHDTLSKYCIPPKKENCNPREEGKYDPNYNFCLCEDDGMVYNKSQRKCVECTAGTHYRKEMKNNICKVCPAGTFSKSGSAFCIGCPKGEFQPDSGQSECKKCNSNACYEVRKNRTSCEYKCTSSTPICNNGNCIECLTDSHCGSTKVCEGNICIAKPNCSGCYGTYQRSSNSCGYSCSGGQVCVSNSCQKKVTCGECYTYNSTTNKCYGGPEECKKGYEQDGCGCRRKIPSSCKKNDTYCNEDKGLICDEERCSLD